MLTERSVFKYIYSITKNHAIKSIYALNVKGRIKGMSRSTNQSKCLAKMKRKTKGIESAFNVHTLLPFCP